MLKTLKSGQFYIDHIDDPDLTEAERAHMEEYGAKSILYIPLWGGEMPIGYAEVWESRQKRQYNAPEISICDQIAVQAAYALENNRMYKQIVMKSPKP